MWKWIDETLQKFRYCFSRPQAFACFVIIVIGLMIRSDHLGVTSIVRELDLVDAAYRSLLHFFLRQKVGL